jgi:hypothetical protein
MQVREPDDAAVRAIVVDGLAAGDAVTDIARALRDFHGDRSTYPAAVLMELAADAFPKTRRTATPGTPSADTAYRVRS